MRHLNTLITVVIVACFTPHFGGAQEKPRRFNFGYSSISGSQAILRVIHDAGILHRNGLDPSMVFIAGGTGVIQALIAGDLPLAIVSGEPAILARLQGADTVILAGLINIIDFSIIAAPEIKKPQDLKGKKIAVSRYGSSTDFVMRYALERWGLAPDRDTAILQLGGQPTRFAALRNGTVQATIVGPPADIIARKSGLSELASAEQLNLAYPNTSIVSSAVVVSRNEEIVKRALRSIVEGIHFLKTQKQASMKSIDAFARLGDADLIDETYRHYAEMLPRLPYPDLKGIQNVLDETAKREPRAKTVKPESFTDTRFLKELEASGLTQRLYR